MVGKAEEVGTDQRISSSVGTSVFLGWQHLTFIVFGSMFGSKSYGSSNLDSVTQFRYLEWLTIID